MKRWLTLLLPLLLISCSTTGMKGQSDNSPPRRVEGSRIFVGETLHAELVIVGQRDNSDSCRGIAIYYPGWDQYEWISPKKGWALQKENGEIIIEIRELQEMWVGEPWDLGYRPLQGLKRVSGESYFKLEWRGNVKISKDGLRVSYQDPGLFGWKEREYKVK